MKKNYMNKVAFSLVQDIIIVQRIFPGGERETQVLVIYPWKYCKIPHRWVESAQTMVSILFNSSVNGVPPLLRAWGELDPHLCHPNPLATSGSNRHQVVYDG